MCALKSEKSSSDILIDKLALDIKGVMLLLREDERVSESLHTKIIESHDEDMREFTKIIRRKRIVGTKRLFFMATGEIILCSLLVIVGISLISPSLLGFLTPSDLLRYFESVNTSLESLGLYLGLVILIDFVLAMMLLLSAFYSLREAAGHLKEAGLAV